MPSTSAIQFEVIFCLRAHDRGFFVFLSKAADAVTVVDADVDVDTDAVSVSAAGAAAVFKSGSATRKLNHDCGNTTEGRLNGDVGS